LRIRIRKNPKLIDGSESKSEKKFGFGSNHKKGWKKYKHTLYVEIIINRSKNGVLTQVRTSILSVPVHLHEKRISDTLQNLYFLYHFCRIRIRKKIWIRIRKIFFLIRNTENEKENLEKAPSFLACMASNYY
jgi:hypothetical protein